VLGGAGAPLRAGAPRATGRRSEDEAVKRFQAFVRASGMGEVIRANDGRMWDIAHAEGPQVGGAWLGGVSKQTVLQGSGNRLWIESCIRLRTAPAAS
jgi:hypothetical protein